MPDHKIELALAFLQSHPDAAASILEQQPVDEVAPLLQELPHAVVARVLERVLPQYTARLCKYLTPGRCAPLLSHMNFSHVSAVLRYSSVELRHQLIDALPEKTRLACQFLLNYAEDTVGAWMTVQATSVPGDSTAGQALKSLVDHEELVLIDTIFVVDRDRHLQGELSYATLMRADANTAIATLVQSRVPTILGRTTLETAIKLELWEHRDVVAVINRQNQFVGVLRHVDLRRGIAQLANRIETPVGSDPITSLLSVYGNSLFSLLDTVGEFATNKHQQVK